MARALTVILVIGAGVPFAAWRLSHRLELSRPLLPAVTRICPELRPLPAQPLPAVGVRSERSSCE